MATARTPWGAAIDAVLADGDWHDREQLLAAGAAAVPPGVAHRKGERIRLALHGWGTPGPRKFGDDATAIASGARRVASDILRTRHQSGTVERDGDRYRRRASK